MNPKPAERVARRVSSMHVARNLGADESPRSGRQPTRLQATFGHKPCRRWAGNLRRSPAGAVQIAPRPGRTRRRNGMPARPVCLNCGILPSLSSDGIPACRRIPSAFSALRTPPESGSFADLIPELRTRRPEAAGAQVHEAGSQLFNLQDAVSGLRLAPPLTMIACVKALFGCSMRVCLARFDARFDVGPGWRRWLRADVSAIAVKVTHA